jgi:hypothetical protein
MPNETFHVVGVVEYKVDHVKKKVYRKQVLAKNLPEREYKIFARGYKWIDTNGDYAQFMGKYSASVSACPEIDEDETQQLPPPDMDEQPAELPPQLLKARKLGKRSSL